MVRYPVPLMLGLIYPCTYVCAIRKYEHSHKDSGSMGLRNGVKERDTVLVRGFYKAGTKTTPCFRDGIVVSRSRNGTLDPESCDYGQAK